MTSRRLVPALLSVTVAAAAVAPFAQAQTPYLLRDFTTTSLGSSPSGIVEFNGVAYFQATRADTGSELWRSDGTAAGTTLVLDIRPGPESSAPSRLAVAGGRLFFFANDGINGVELWCSDASETRMVRDLAPGPQSLNFLDTPIVDMGGIAYFRAAISGVTSLYLSDGTAPGTVLITTCEGDCVALGRPAVLGNRLLFAAQTLSTGWEPWSSDGSTAGTGIIRDLVAGPGDSLVARMGLEFFVDGPQAFFAAYGVGSGLEPWVTDGTAAGTRLLADLQPGSVYSMLPFTPVTFGAMAGYTWFEASGAGGRWLWRTDGTATDAIAMLPDLCTNSPIRFFSNAGLLYFTRRFSGGLASLWRSDATAAGTFTLGAVADPETGFAALGPAVFFAGKDAVAGNRLWTTDGTLSGTVPVVDFPGPASGRISHLTAVASQVFFSAPVAPSSTDLWVSDGTAAGTRVPRLINDGPTQSSWPGLATVMGDEVCLRALSATAESPELWCSDGTPAATRRIDLPCSQPGCFDRMDNVQGRLLLSLDAGPGLGFEPWLTDGTPAGMVSLGDWCFPDCSSDVVVLAQGDGFALLGATTSLPSTSEVWRSDGSAPGTFSLARTTFDRDPGLTGVALAGVHYFMGGDAANGAELWRSDGTVAGTFEVADINPSGSSSPNSFAAHAGRVLFAADDGARGRALWSSDGTERGTQLLSDIRSDSLWSPQSPRVLGNRVFFYAYDIFSNLRFWVSDGTAGGTSLIGNPTNLAPSSIQVVSAGGLVFYLGGWATRELWRTDGSASGTQKIANLSVGSSASAAIPLLSAGGRVWFFGEDALHGRELWSSDGTPGGTQMVADVLSGPDSSLGTSVPWLAANSTHLLFPADDGVHGVEPWALELPVGARLLRNADARALTPLAPARASLWPLETVRDHYVDNFVTGESDPDNPVLADRARPLVSYALAGAGTIKLVKNRIGQVQIDF